MSNYPHAPRSWDLVFDHFKREPGETRESHYSRIFDIAQAKADESHDSLDVIGSKFTRMGIHYVQHTLKINPTWIRRIKGSRYYYCQFHVVPQSWKSWRKIL